MAASPSSDLVTAIIFVVLIVAVLARRTYLMVEGTRYSTAQLVGFTVFFAVLFAALALPTILGGFVTWGVYGWLIVALYVVVPAVAAWVAIPYVRRIVRFEQRGGGTWYYRLPWLIPVLYLTLFVVRFVLEIAIVGVAAVTSFAVPSSIPAGLFLVLVGVDVLFGFSLGLLIGRSIGVHQAFAALPRTPATGGVASPPLPQNP